MELLAFLCSVVELFHVDPAPAPPHHFFAVKSGQDFLSYLFGSCFIHRKAPILSFALLVLHLKEQIKLLKDLFKTKTKILFKYLK